MIIDKKLLDEISACAQKSERLRMNYNLHTSSEAPAQRLLNALEPGTIIPIHRHTQTSETYILLRGKIDVSFYNKEGIKTDHYTLNPETGDYGIHIPAGVWHGVEVLEHESVIFEVKEGPYCPISKEDILQ